MRRGPRSGLYTLIAIHSTVRGPSLGGCRLWGYGDARLAVRDVLRLSRAMTFKAAVADLPLGGGKGVIMAPPMRPSAQGGAAPRCWTSAISSSPRRGATSPQRTSGPRAGTWR